MIISLFINWIALYLAINWIFFCPLDYDYIGAEWLYGLECHVNDRYRWFFGNGGFSLRKVSSFINWISNNQNLVEYTKSFLLEDLVIAIYGKDCLRIADREVAMEFSFDIYPKECFGLMGKRLPFGCHAWHRFDPLFWQNIIENYGYRIDLVEANDETILLSSGKERFEKMEKFFDHKKIEECIKRLLPKFNGKINVFGAGLYGFSFVNMARDTNIYIESVLDNDIEKIGKNMEGIPIVSPEYVARDEESPILIALANPKPVEEQFRTMGLTKGVDYILSRDLQAEMCII